VGPSSPDFGCLRRGSSYLSPLLLTIDANPPESAKREAPHASVVRHALPLVGPQKSGQGDRVNHVPSAIRQSAKKRPPHKPLTCSREAGVRGVMLEDDVYEPSGTVSGDAWTFASSSPIPM
jgi:hypothetical protein